jgi:eukaryotic-like serine/threonine-protein kinase
MDASSTDRGAILEQLEKVLSSPVFRRADRSSALLRFIVEETLNGQADRLKEYTLGSEALGRGDSFDPRTDPIVRAEASRLRTRLEQYYKTIGRADSLLLLLPKGNYVAQFTSRPSSDLAIAALQDAEPRGVRFSTAPWFAWVCVVAALALAAAAWTRVRPPGDNPQPLLQFEVELKSDGVLASDVGNEVVLSPAGTRVVFVSRTADGRTHLNTRRLDQPKVTRLPGTDGARGPFVSPDGRWVGFWADGKLKKTPVDGGSPVILCDATDLLGASWGVDDTIIAALAAAGKLWRIPAAGGVPEVAIDLSAEATLARWPQILPGGQFVMYTASTGAGADRATIEVQSIRGGDRKMLVRGGTFGRYLASGHLTYVNQGTLYAVPFDLAALAIDGVPAPVLDDVSYSPLFGYAQVDVAQTGTLLFRRGAESELSVVDWIDRSGKRTSLVAKPGRYGWLRLSPDGRRLALTATESGVSSILIYDVQKGETTRVTTRPGDYSGLTWLPNGDVLAFGGAAGMGWVRPDRPGEATPLMDVRTAQTPWSVEPGGRRLAYYEKNPDSGFDLWTAAITAHRDRLTLGAPELFLRTPAFEVYPSFSPDGRWIAYGSNESGAWEIYVRRFPDNGTKVRISNSGGVIPRWSLNRRELLYRTDGQRLMVAPYKAAGDSFVSDSPRPWSPQLLADTGVLPNFDLAPDGERILALVPASRSEDQQSANHVTVMLNFLEEVRRRTTPR